MAWFRPMGMDSVAYHRATVLGRSDDHEGQALGYYASRGETPLCWGGRLAERLGLEGAVDEAGYEALFGVGGARDPHLGTRLVGTRRPGVELVVAAHKSVAVLGLVGQAEDMHAILDAETDATLEFLESWMSRQGGRRGKAQRRCGTSGLVWARTRHATSRSGDPAPHDHVLVANLTEMADGAGGWKGLDTALVRDVTHAATMAGRMAGAAEAVRRGYAIVADAGPSGRLDHWAVAGIPAKVCDAFSKRRDEIDLAMESSGFSSYRARGIAARATRAPKATEPTESLLARWMNELDRIDWPTRKLRERLRLVNERDARPLRTLGAGERSEVVRSLLGNGGPLAGRKAFTRADVVRLAAPALYGCDPAELEAVVAAVVADPEALALVGTPTARSRAYVAASVVAAEAAVEEVAARLAGSGDRPAVTPVVVTRSVTAAEDRLGRSLTDGQRRAVAAICGSGRGLDVVVGVAGSGRPRRLRWCAALSRPRDTGCWAPPSAARRPAPWPPKPAWRPARWRRWSGAWSTASSASTSAPCC